MSKLNKSKIFYPIWSAILGKTAFFISGLIALLLVLGIKDDTWAQIIAGPLAGLLLGFFTWKDRLVG